MDRKNLRRHKSRLSILAILPGLFCALAFAVPLHGKMKVDFDPNAPFSQYKTYAYIGGIEKLVMLQVNPDMINVRVRRAVQREMTLKGLREVQPSEHPDLVVRYWVESQVDVNVAAQANWGIYQPYIGTYWGFMYNTINASSTRQATLILDLIDANRKDLAWRLYIQRKIINVDKDWKKADQEFTKGFESYPPSAKEIAAKKKERAEHPPKPE